MYGSVSAARVGQPPECQRLQRDTPGEPQRDARTGEAAPGHGAGQREDDQHPPERPGYESGHRPARARHPQPGRVLRQVHDRDRRERGHCQRASLHTRAPPQTSRAHQPQRHRDHEGADPDRPHEEHSRAHHAHHRHPCPSSLEPPPRERPPSGDDEQLRRDLGEEARLEKAVEAVRPRREQNEADGRERDREARPHLTGRDVRDQEQEGRLQRDRDRKERIHRAVRVDADERSGNGDQQVQSRRVMRHLAECRLAAGAIHQMPRAFDRIHQHQVVRQIRRTTGWQQRGPDRPDQHRQDGAENQTPRPERRRESSSATRSSCQADGGAREDANRRHEPRGESRTHRAEPVRGNDNRSHRRGDARRKPKAHRVAVGY